MNKEVKNGEDIIANTESEITPLMRACYEYRTWHYKVVEEIIKQPNLNINGEAMSLALELKSLASGHEKIINIIKTTQDMHNNLIDR